MPAAVRSQIRDVANRRGVLLLVDETMRELDLRSEPASLPTTLRAAMS